MSSYIFPRPSSNNVTNRGFRNTQFFAKSDGKSTTLWETSYHFYLFFVELRKIVLGSFMRIESAIPSVSLVLFACAPFQVLGSVVSSIAVFVVDLGKILRIFYKGLCHETMHQKFLLLSWLSKQRNNIVPMTYLSGLQKNTVMTSSSFSRMRPNSPVLVSGINIFKSRDWFHVMQLRFNT